jgi:hypothetical protein
LDQKARTFKIGEIVKISCDDHSSFHFICTYRELPTISGPVTPQFTSHKNLNKDLKYMISDLHNVKTSEGPNHSDLNNMAYAKLIGSDSDFWISTRLLEKI